MWLLEPLHVSRQAQQCSLAGACETCPYANHFGVLRCEGSESVSARQAYHLTLAGFAALAGATQLISLSIDHLQARLARLCAETSSPQGPGTLAVTERKCTVRSSAFRACEGVAASTVIPGPCFAVIERGCGVP